MCLFWPQVISSASVCAEVGVCTLQYCCRVRTPTLAQTVAALEQIQKQVRQSINEWVSYPYWWHFVASVTIISFVVCLFRLPKNLLHFVASATVISFATCPLWSLWLLWTVKENKRSVLQFFVWACMKSWMFERRRISRFFFFQLLMISSASCAWLKADRKCWHFCVTYQLIREYCL